MLFLSRTAGWKYHFHPHAPQLQPMTDHFMIKEEFCWQREEGEEDIINDEHNEEEAEELFQYISDIGEGEESNDDHAGQDVDNVPASPVWRSHQVKQQPGCYHTLASGNNQCTWWSFDLLVYIVSQDDGIMGTSA